MSERLWSYKLKRPVTPTPAVDAFGDPRPEIEVVTFKRDYMSTGDIKRLVREYGSLSLITDDEATRTLAMTAEAEILSGLPEVDFDNIEASDLAELLKEVSRFFPPPTSTNRRLSTTKNGPKSRRTPSA